jgi:ubiquinone/menaquinone biosynthesis C-methylase UbiE
MSVQPDYREHLANVRDYWQRAHDAYLESVGTTFQGALIETGEAGDAVTRSNLHMAARAGIRAGDRVLDAGCGVCGPAIDIARNIDGAKIIGITLIPKQAHAARALIRDHGLSGRVQVTLADFHSLPFPDACFDVVYFLESSGYAFDPALVFSEAARVLRPGGRLYVKDVFRREEPLTEVEREDVARFDRTWAFRTAPMSSVRAALETAGFDEIESRDLSNCISTDHAVNAMAVLRGDELEPTRFGELHLAGYFCSAVFFGEFRARRSRGPVNPGLFLQKRPNFVDKC